MASTASVAQLVLSDPVNPGLGRPVIGDRPEFRPSVFKNNPVFRRPIFVDPLVDPLVDPFAGCPIVADDDLMLDDSALR